MMKNVKFVEYKCCDCFCEYTNFKDDLTEQKFLCCNENYKNGLMRT